MNKKELEKKKQSKKQEKQKRKDIRKSTSGSKSFEEMIAYVDENGMIADTPPDPTRKKEKIEAESIAISTPKKEDIEYTPLNGRVEYFNTEKGYGFIKDASSSEKYFFHINNAPASIAEGNLVTFDLERGKIGMNAMNITIVK